MTNSTRKRKPRTAPIRGDFTSRMLTIEQACQYLNRGRTRTRQFCDKVGATVRMGERCVRYDRTIIDKALDEMEQAAGNTETA